MAAISMVGALLAALFYGAASVLQAIGARTVRRTDGVDPRLLVRVLGSLPFVLGVLLDALGFAAELAALRSLPLFAVQAAVASSLAVTAVLAARMLREPLGRADWAAVGAVCLGLALLGVSAGAEGSRRVGTGFDVALGVTLVVLAAAGMIAARLPRRVRAAALGLAAGVGFGVVALAARTLRDLAPDRLLREPATYLIAAAGILSFLRYATALQQGAVTTATAALVVAETIAPALVGTIVLGDRSRPGLGAVALLGFLLAVAGALALARFGEVGAPEAEPAPDTAPVKRD